MPSWFMLPTRRTRWLLVGLGAVTLASLLLALLALGDAWNRPVNAVADIPGRSAITDRHSGRVRNAADAKYDADLRSGDQIIAFDGLPWEQIQRMNLHERTSRAAGSTIPILVLRGGQPVEAHTRVLLPDAREQLVLMRQALSALVGWLATVLVLGLWVRHERRSPTPFAASSVPLWFLVWQMVSVAQSIGSLKYPAAVMWNPALFCAMQMLVALVSLPFPLAPPSLRPRWVSGGLALLALGGAAATLWPPFHSPYVAQDWRYAVQLLTSADAAWQWTLLAGLCGVLLAAGGMLAPALSTTAASLLRGVVQVLPPRLQARCEHALDWIAQTYQQCPPAVVVIAQIQALIVLLYVIFDRIPQALDGAGSGFSVLLTLIPWSYLLLYSDVRAQALGHQLVRYLVIIVLALQTPSLALRLWNGTYGAGADSFGYLTIAALMLGILGGGAYILVDQQRRQRAAFPPARAAIAQLFTASNVDVFWHTLVQVVGPEVGVQTWLWLRRDNAGVWHRYRQTPNVRIGWLAHPNMRAALQERETLHPVSFTVDADSLPSTLIVFPVPHAGRVAEAFVAANPRRIKDSERLLDSALVYAPLVNALQTLQLVAQQQRLLLAYQRLAKQERDDQRITGVRIIARLHDHGLQELARLIEGVGQMHRQNARVPAGFWDDDGDATHLSALVRDLRAINGEIKQSLRELRLRTVKQRLNDTLDDLVSGWEAQHPAVFFRYDAPQRDPPLNEDQREIVRLIVKEAVTNALKHAAPRIIIVALELQPGALLASVRDDGRGFAMDALNDDAALGIPLMHDLAAQIGATLTVISTPTQGCAVRLLAPLPT